MQVRLEPIIPPMPIFNIPQAESRIRAAVNNSRKRAQDRLKTYPGANINNSPYVRTGQLSRGWGVRQVEQGDTIEVIFNNSMRYAIFVHGDESGDGQQEQHAATGWPNLREVLEETSEQMASDIEEAVNAI